MIDFAEQPGGGPELTPIPKAGDSPCGPQPALPGKLDTGNQFLVGAIPGKDLVTIVSMRCHLTKAQAVNLAAWLSVVADPGGEEFERVVKEIKNS